MTRQLQHDLNKTAAAVLTAVITIGTGLCWLLGRHLLWTGLSDYPKHA